MATSKFRVGTFNNISRVGLSRFRQSAYQIGALDDGEPIQDPQAIMIRSHKLQVNEIPKSVCAIARCGAGTNNIPVSDLSDRGIPVFNTPGANANAVKELVLCGMLLASRRVHQGINHVKEVANDEGVDVAIGRVESDKKIVWGSRIDGENIGGRGFGCHWCQCRQRGQQFRHESHWLRSSLDRGSSVVVELERFRIKNGQQHGTCHRRQ